MRYNFALALPVVAALLATAPSAQAQTRHADDTAEDAFAAALGCTKQRAITVALKAVGGGHVIFVVFDRLYPPPHWDVFIIGNIDGYLVWVNAACRVIRTYTDPLL
jgi:hypothetical protein